MSLMTNIVNETVEPAVNAYERAFSDLVVALSEVESSLGLIELKRRGSVKTMLGQTVQQLEESRTSVEELVKALKEG